MEKQNTKIGKIVKMIKSPSFIYLTIFFIFLIAVGVLFLLSTNFIIRNVNNIFSPTNDGATQALDLNSYSIVAKRLGIPVSTDVGQAATTTSTSKNLTTLVVPTATSTTSQKSVTLSVLNSTSKKGVASSLAAALEQAGFSKVSTGNERKFYPITTILVKSSKNEFSALAVSIVKKSYPKATVVAAAGTEAFDVTIIIGAE